MKRLLPYFLLFPLVANALTVDVTLNWGKVTAREDGSSIAESSIKYQAYYAPLGSSEVWSALPLIAGTESTISYTDLDLPDTALGVQVYMVTIDTVSSITGDPSNIGTAQIDSIDVPIPIDPKSPPGPITINLNAVFKAN